MSPFAKTLAITFTGNVSWLQVSHLVVELCPLVAKKISLCNFKMTNLFYFVQVF